LPCRPPAQESALCGAILAVGLAAATASAQSAHRPITDVGKYVEIRRRQADGSWLIAVDIFNSDLPPPK
jgi:ketosteroid isomerase-like protein